MAILNTSLYEQQGDIVRDENRETSELYDRIQKQGDEVTLEDEWNAVYHFSSLRQNVLCWYPFKKDCTILEIGNNYGELTGMLVGKAKQVTVCEKDMLRAKIILERCLKAENVEIITGDFRKLPEDTKYDYIILNGTLENAGDLIGNEDNPYLRLLTEAKRLLKDDGRILAAVDNRLGLRYFSGAPDEKLGESFAGIEGNWEEHGPRTFDRQEISDLINEAGLTVNQWFYPFPDYKFTKEIFTDASLDQIIPNFAGEITDKDRLVLFSEQKVQRSLAENHVAPCFCNSFLVEITKKKSKNTHQGYDYIKVSNDRDKRFTVYTILDYNADKAYKVPCTEEGKKHLMKMCDFSLDERKIRTLPYHWDGEKAVCDLLHSETLLDRLDNYAKKGEQQGYWQLIEKLRDALYSRDESKKQYGPEFEKVFGSRKAGQELKWTEGLPFDCMAGNIYIEKEQWTLIDYEWLFDCAIPAEFILWRTLYQLKMYTSMHSMFENRDTNAFIGINSDTEEVFLEWEDGFENNYAQVKVNLRSGKKRIRIEEIQNELEKLIGEVSELNIEKNRLAEEAQAKQEELKKQIQRQSNEIIALNTDKKTLAEEAKTQQEELKKQIQRQSNEIVVLNEEKRKLAKDVQNIINALNEEKRRVAEDAQNKIDALNEKNRRTAVDAEARIADLNEEKQKLAEESQAKLEDISAQNRQLSGEIDNLKNENKEISLQKKITENELRMTAESLRHIQDSGMYRFSLKYYKVRDAVFPEGSKRQRCIKTIIHKIKREDVPGRFSGTYTNQIEHLLNYGKFESVGIITTPHTMYIAKLFEKELMRLSIETVIHTGEPKEYEDIPYIIICPQFVRQFPALYIAVQMEQTVSSRWFNDDYFEKLQNSCAIFDYSLENIDFYQQGKYKDIYSRVYYLPVDSYPGFAETETEPEKEYDVVFYGDAKSCERRRNILNEVSKDFKVKICSEMFGEDVYNEIRKAKVLLNIHYYEGALLETTRLYETLSLNTCVIVSEDSKDKGERQRLESLVDFAEIGNIEELKRKIRYWVEHDQERKEKIKANRDILDSRPNAFTFFFQRFMLACDQIDFNRFYKMCGDYVTLESNRICLSLPESTVRRRSFDASNKYGFTVFPGLRNYKGWVGCGLSYKMIFTKAHEAGMKEVMICEDDVIFPEDFAEQIDRIHAFLHSRPRWSVFSGLIADVGKVTAVTEREKMGDASILKIDHMVSTVFNIYNKEMFRHFMKWNEQNRDVHKNAIDRYLENKDLAIYVRVPFLVGHDEELDSSVWGFSNVAYIDWIKNSENKLLEMAEEFKK